MPDQAETGDVGAGMNGVARREHRLHRVRVQRDHTVNRIAHIGFSDEIPLQRRAQDSRPDRFREYQTIARPGSGQGDYLVGPNFADRHQPILRLGVVDRVTAQNEGTGFLRHVRATAQRVGKQLEQFGFARPRDEVEGEQRSCSHRVDVAERVGRGDSAERVRVVHNGGEEVYRGDQRAIFPQLEDRRVVPCRGVDQYA